MVTGRQKALVAGVIAVAVLGVASAALLSRSDRQRVKRQFRVLSQLVSKEEKEHVMVLGRKAQKIGNLFGNPCKLSTPAYELSGTYTPTEIASNAARIRAQFSTISLEFEDVEVEFDDEATAAVTLALHLVCRGDRADVFRETHEARCLLRKIDGEWLFTDWTVVEVLRK